MNDPCSKSLQSTRTEPQLHHYTDITPIYTHKHFGPSRTSLTEQWPSNQLIWGRDLTAHLFLLIYNARPFLPIILSTSGLDLQPQHPPLAHRRKHRIKTKSFPGCMSPGAPTSPRRRWVLGQAEKWVRCWMMLDTALLPFWPHKLLALCLSPCLQRDKKRGGKPLHS